jgi:hypothetical protein
VATIKQGQSLDLDYRFLVFESEMPGTATIQKWWDEYARVTAPSPVPPVSVVPAEQPAAQPAAKSVNKPAKKSKAKAKKDDGGTK